MVAMSRCRRLGSACLRPKARPSPSRSRQAAADMTRGTSNVFADLGYPDAEERQTKLPLAFAINEMIASKRLTRSGAATRLGSGSRRFRLLPTISLKASVERLMTFLTALDRDVEITIRKTLAGWTRPRRGGLSHSFGPGP